MKKSTTWALFPAIILFFVVVSPASAKKALGLVTYKKGTAHLYIAGKKRSLRKGMVVGQGDRIRTKRKAAVTVQLRSGVIFRIGGNSNVTIEKLQKKVLNLKMSHGSVGARVRKGRRAKVKITSPTAIAGVRGTDVIVESPKTKDPAKSTTKVMVNKGNVEVTDPAGGNKKNCGPGQKVTATTKGLQRAIMEKYEKQKFRMFQQFKAVKERHLKNLIEQKRRNREMLEEILKRTGR